MESASEILFGEAAKSSKNILANQSKALLSIKVLQSIENLSSVDLEDVCLYTRWGSNKDPIATHLYSKQSIGDILDKKLYETSFT